MSIRVTCSGCHTRFSVSERFAGREGPCPKCKKTIQIPDAASEVKVHAPENFGPKTASGQAVLKPIFRKETSISAVQGVLIGAVIIGFLAIAFVFRFGVADKAEFSSLLLGLLAVIVAMPCVYGAYLLLRDAELESLTGQDLWMRVGICAGLYGLSWAGFWIANQAFVDDFGSSTLFGGVAFMFLVSPFVANLFMGIDWLMGLLHFGMYFSVCLLLRWIAGFDLLPATLDAGQAEDAVSSLIQSGLAMLI